MKHLLFVLLVIVLAFTNVNAACRPFPTTIITQAESCFQDLSEADREVLANDPFNQNQTIKCFYKCVMEGLKFLRNGEFSIENMSRMIDEHIDDKPLAELVKARHENSVQEASTLEGDCDKAQKFAKSYYAADANQELISSVFCPPM